MLYAIDSTTKSKIEVVSKEDMNTYIEQQVSSILSGGGGLSLLGVTASVDELNYCSGLTSNIQTQLTTINNDIMYTGECPTEYKYELNNFIYISGKADPISPVEAEQYIFNILSSIASGIESVKLDLNGKQSTITGGASTITSSNLTASRALISNSSGKVAVSAVTSTELGYLDGVTSNIQTQLNNLNTNKYGPGSTPIFPAIEFASSTLATCHIDWHYNNSSADYTSRLIENVAGSLYLYSQAGSAYGWFHAAGYAIESSKHIKTNINPIEDNEALKILELNPVSFDYKNGDTNKRGFIAEEVMKILPTTVQVPEGYDEETFEYNPDGNNIVPSIDYASFVPYIIKLQQIHDREIKQLKEKIKSLSN